MKKTRPPDVVLPAELPPLGPDRPFVRPRVDTFTLENGLEVWSVETPGFPLVALRLVIRGGRGDDAPQVPGFAELLADAREEGTRSRGAVELFDLLQDAGGDLKADATADAATVTAYGLASSLPLLAELTADVVRNAAFPDEGVRRVKALALEDLTTDESEPAFLASRALSRLLYRRHPYATVAPTRTSIRAVTPALLRAERGRRLRPERALLVVAGAVRDVAGVETELSTTGGTSDARFIRSYCPVLEFGLVGESMHKVDEKSAVADLKMLARVYETVLDRYFAS